MFAILNIEKKGGEFPPALKWLSFLRRKKIVNKMRTRARDRVLGLVRDRVLDRVLDRVGERVWVRARGRAAEIAGVSDDG